MNFPAYLYYNGLTGKLKSSEERGKLVAKRKFDIRVMSTGVAGMIAGGAYQAEAFETATGNKTGLYAYGNSAGEATSKVVQKVRERYGSDAEIIC